MARHLRTIADHSVRLAVIISQPAVPTTLLPLRQRRRIAAGPVQFELVDAPEGIEVQSAEAAGRTARMLITCDSEKVEPGLKGNLIAVAFVMVTPPPPDPGSPRSRLGRMTQAMDVVLPTPNNQPWSSVGEIQTATGQCSTSTCRCWLQAHRRRLHANRSRPLARRLRKEWRSARCPRYRSRLLNRSVSCRANLQTQCNPMKLNRAD